jgi:two-component system NtrC family response regulator
MEADLLTAMRSKGVAPPSRRGLKETEAEIIGKALAQYRWNITETARVLGIGRNTLYRKIRQYELQNP